jgi:tRNA/tmRNA/rRNA uracil-C5-methylase (TrmA/RlmC/RlmD family)
MGILFGKRRNNDNSGVIRALIASNEENHRRFLAMMEQSEKSHKEIMKILSDEIKNTKEQSQKILYELREDLRKKDEEYENKKKAKKEKKKLLQKQASEQLINDINNSKALILKECENDFDCMKDIYCLKDIENIKINDDIEELFIELFESENTNLINPLIIIIIKILLLNLKKFLNF